MTNERAGERAVERAGWAALIPTLFPTLARLEPDSATCLGNAGRRVNVPRGTVLFRAGDRCHTFMMVLDGAVRVQMASETGREIVLYRVSRGETCIVTTACLLTDNPYSAEAVAETDIDAVALAAGPFHDLVARSAAFRDFVFASFGNRLTGMMMLIEEVAFGRVDLRLARFLADRRDGAGGLDITHQALAVELGTAREVVSRQLKEFERRGLVALSRGRIEVLDPAALGALAGQ